MPPPPRAQAFAAAVMIDAYYGGAPQGCPPNQVGTAVLALILVSVTRVHTTNIPYPQNNIVPLAPHYVPVHVLLPRKGGARLAGDSGAAQAYPAPTVRNLSITNLVATGTVGPHHIEPIQPFDCSLAPTRPRKVSGWPKRLQVGSSISVEIQR